MSDPVNTTGLASEAGSPSSGAVGGSVPSFTWRHAHKLDGQKRVTFPSDWRPGSPEVCFTLVLWPHPHSGRKFGFINGLTPQRFQALQAKLDQAGQGDQKAGALRRAIFANSISLPLDPAGRLCVPPRMADEIGLTKDVLFVGAGGEFQIWDPATFQKCTDAEAALAADAYNLI
jgi:DNA-binding transcriptional regulator/RsmH inhibitor MraZ